jgi:glycosyltransferase involved in cell wall biosynthesis
MDEPFLHVFIPAYGRSPYLTDAIESAIDSVLDSTPITVIDDGSPTEDVWKAAQQFQPRVNYIRNETNLGISGNFLNAFKLSSGTFTIVIGSDDRMLPGYEVELRKTLLSFPNATVVQPQVIVMNSDGKTCLPLVDRVKATVKGRVSRDYEIKPMALIRKLFIGDFMYFPSISWRTDVLKSANWDLTYKNAVDLDLLFKLSLASEPFVFQVAKTFKYRRHSESVSSVLAQEETRLREELAAHWMAANLLPEYSTFSTKLLANLAPTVRIHAMIIGLKQVPKYPLKGIKHFFKSFSWLKSL